MRTVFISSTFRDMQAERDAIRDIAAPILNEEARIYGDEIDFCDLRWGINTADLESDTASRKVLDVCLDEIDRCKPPMIVLLGYRYGWIPDKSLIENAAARKNKQLEARKLQQMQLNDLEMSVTALEIEYGALRDSVHFSNTLFYFREIDGTAPSEYQSEDYEHALKVNALKDRIRAIGGDRIKTYSLRWNGSDFDGIDEFAHTLANDVKDMLMPQWEETKTLKPFERERRAHQIFIEEKSKLFLARQTDAENLYSDILNNPITIIKGTVGSGKSTLFCHLVQRFQQLEEWVVIPFISGLTNDSNDAYDIIENTVYFLEEELHLSHFKETTDDGGQLIYHGIKEWRSRLAEMCAAYTANGRKIIIMLDAVDQLTPSEARDLLFFIPVNVGTKIHFVMTSTMDFLSPGLDFYTLFPLSDKDKRAVITGTLNRAGRELTKNVVEEMIALKSSNNPLFLSLLIQRLLLMNGDDFSVIRSRGRGIAAIESHQIDLLKQGCPDNLDEMSVALLTEAGRRINPTLVSKAGQLIAVSRAGLRSRDLSALLGDSWTDIDFAHFISYMNDCFMLRDDGRYDFTHKSIRAGFMKLCPNVEEINRLLLEYLKNLPIDDPFRCSEIIYHTIRADDKNFYIDYIIRQSKLGLYHPFLTIAANDTYNKCLTDEGEWIISVLRWVGLIPYNEKCDIKYFSRFVSHELSSSFGCSKHELEIQLIILKENVVFSEKLTSTEDDYIKWLLSFSYEVVAGIYEKLDGHENLERALELYNKCLEISEQLEKELGTPESRSDLSISYLKIADIHEKFGGHENLEYALELYKKSLVIMEQLVKDLGTVECRRDLLVSYERVAGIYEKFGGRDNLEYALDLYNKCHGIWEQLAKELGTEKSRSDLSLNYEKVADIYEKLDGHENLERALKLYNKCLEINEQLVKELGTADSIRTLSGTYSRIAGIYCKFGGCEELEYAMELYNKSLAIMEQLAKDLGTAESIRDLTVSYERVAGIYEKFGGRANLERALELHNQCLEIRRQLAKELGTANIIRDLSVSYEKVACIYEEFGGIDNLERALELYNNCLGIMEQLAQELGTANSRSDLSVSYERVARIYEKFGGHDDLEYALEMCNKCLEIREQLVKELGTVESRYALSVIYLKIASIYEKFGGRENLECALEMLNKGLEIRRQLSQELGTANSKRELSVNYSRIASIYEELGGREDLERALELYIKCLGIMEQLAQELGTASSRNDLLVSYLKIGGVYDKLGKQEHLESALLFYKKALPLSEQLADELGTAESRRALLVNNGRLVGVYKVLGGQENLESALNYAKKALQISEQLAYELCTAESRSDLSIANLNLAGIYEDLGGIENLKRALINANKALQISEQLAKDIGTEQSRSNLNFIKKYCYHLSVNLGRYEEREEKIPVYSKEFIKSKLLSAQKKLGNKNLLFCKPTDPIVVESIRQYAPNVNAEDVIAIDNRTSKLFSFGKVKGLLFTKDAFYSSYFDGIESISYASISNAALSVDGISFKLKNGKRVVCDFGSANEFILAFLSELRS